MDISKADAAIEKTRRVLTLFYKERDIDGVMECMSEDATWIGPGENEIKFSYQDILEYFEAGREHIPKCDIVADNIHVVYSGEDTCIVAGDALIHTRENSEMVVEVRQRASFFYRWEPDGWKIVHMHLSNPYAEMIGEDYFPKKTGMQNYEYLQQLLREKTAVIDMITDNINGGLKGSNDDENYSYFYVNEGLPEMLGYTYDEFMEKTGGTAVGAVYPPDLPAALASVDRCFAEGPVYAAEYRMEKKDGGFVWVLDSGKKIKDSDGITRINSIVTDITPLKTALFELELERERYRTALQSINDMVFEYDIKNDLYICFQSIRKNGKRELNKIEMPEFLNIIDKKRLVHQEDMTPFKKLLQGSGTTTAEIREKFLKEGGGWRRIQIQCSFIRDKDGMPVKVIGILKDVTAERRKESRLRRKAQTDGLTRLLNQSATKEAVEQYLEEFLAEERSGAMLLIDIDHFKSINDTRGHMFGNEILEGTAAILKAASGKKNIAGRVGGDEFLVFLKKEEDWGAREQAEQILAKMSEMGIEKETDLSCSAGIALVQDVGSDFEMLFRAADQALYEAKNRGRNQYAVYQADKGGDRA